MHDKYQTYTSEELITDPDFRAWVLEPTEALNAFWQGFLAQYPEQAETVDEARLLLQSVWEYFEQEPTSREQLVRYFEAMKKEALSSSPKQVRRPRPLWPQWGRVAAAIGLLLIAGLAYYLGWFGPGQQIYQTAFGERLQIVLPDSSRVDLNANSKLIVSRNWDRTDREVWLEGEAFFTVRKKPATNARFTVHTQGLDIEVLGTEFNVNTRQEKVEVVLKEGQVKLRTQAALESGEQEVLLAPGEVADFSPRTQALTKRQVEETNSYTSWREGYLVYERARLEEVLLEIEDIYGLEINVPDSVLNNKMIRGALPTGDLEELLTTMESLFDVQVVRRDNQLLLQERATRE